MLVTDGISPALRELAEQYPGYFRRAMLAAGQRWKRILGAEMRAGNPAGKAFAPLHWLTKRNKQTQQLGITFGAKEALRSELKKNRQAKDTPLKGSLRTQELTRKRALIKRAYRVTEGFGGLLPELSEFATPQGGVEVGWLGTIKAGIDKSLARWQRNENRALNRQERHAMHRKFGRNLPFTQKERPARPPVEPQQEVFAKDVNTSAIKTIDALVMNAKRKARNR